MRRLTLIPLVLAVPAAVRAQPVDATAFSVVTLDATARGAGLGGSILAAESADAGAFLSNPALLDPALDRRASVGLLDHLSSLRTGTLTYVRELDGIGTAAAAVRYLGWGEFRRTDATGTAGGTFGAGEIVLSVAGARSLGTGLRAGATLHLMRSAIDDRAAHAVAMDAGVLFTRPGNGFALGASVHQLGAVFSSIGSVRDELPTDIRVGVAKKLAHLPLLVSVTAYGFVRGDGSDGGGTSSVFRHLLLGGEFQFSDAFQLRIGYDHRRHEALRMKSRLDFAGVSLGVGIRVRGVTVDYARTSWSTLGGLHRFTVASRL